MKLRGFRDDNVKMFDYLYIFIYIYIYYEMYRI
jgi:hypothetical protein